MYWGRSLDRSLYLFILFQKNRYSTLPIVRYKLVVEQQSYRIIYSGA